MSTSTTHRSMIRAGHWARQLETAARRRAQARRRLLVEHLEDRRLLSLDFGDLPAPYPTLLANNGARHEVVTEFQLGKLIDAEQNGLPSPDAKGDDGNGLSDEDGVSFLTALVPGYPALLQVTATTGGQSAKLDAFLDFNGDGDFADMGERIFNARELNAGPQNFTFNVPSDANTDPQVPKYARFRMSIDGGLLSYGYAANGEVEDYLVVISPPAEAKISFVYDTPPGPAPEDGVVQNVAVQLEVLSGALNADVTIAVPDAGTGTATGGGVDYSYAAQTVTFPRGTTGSVEQVVTVGIVDDLLAEGSETVELKLDPATLTRHPGDMITVAYPDLHRFYIYDNENPPVARFASALSGTTDQIGHNHAVDVLLVLDPGVKLGQDYTYYVDTVGGTAAAGEDYVAFADQPVTFPAGAGDGALAEVTLPILADSVPEGPETVALQLFDRRTGAPGRIALDQHVVTLLDQWQIDVFERAFKQLTLRLPDGSVEYVLLSGTAAVAVGIDSAGLAVDTDDDGLDQVPTELVDLSLTGISSLGPVHVGLNSARRSLGQIEEWENATPGVLDLPPFTATGLANSFFDVFLEIEIGGQVLHTTAAERLQATISHEPPAPGETYLMTTSTYLPLWTADGKPTGLSIVDERLTPEPAREEFALVRKELVLRLENGQMERVVLGGTATVAVWTDRTGVATDSDGDGLDQVPTEMLALDLQGTSSLGLVRATLDPAHRSRGEIEEQTNNWPGQLDLPPYTYAGLADSFFDIFFQLEIGGRLLQAARSEHVRTTISHDPPAAGETYATPPTMLPIPLLDDGQPSGISIVSERLTPVPAWSEKFFPFVQKELVLQWSDGPTELVRLNGTAVVATATGVTGLAADTDGDGLDQVPTELIALNLTGQSSRGPVQVGLDVYRPSRGEIEERVNTVPGQLDVAPFTPGPDNDCDSFFDIWVEVSVEGQTLHTARAEHLQAVITHLPSAPGEAYTTPTDMAPLELLDLYDQPVGLWIASEQLTLDPVHEVDYFPFVHKELVLRLPTGASERVSLDGTATVEVAIDPSGTAADSDGDGLDQVKTLLTELQLTGTCSLGPITLKLDPARLSSGEIEELVNNTAGKLDLPPFTAGGMAFSFFDVFLQVEVGGLVLVTQYPEPLRALITHKPPAPGETYSTPTAMEPIPLVAAGGLYSDGQNALMWIVSERLTPIPLGTIRVVKDALPDDPQDFAFSSPQLGPFVLDDDSDLTWPSTRTFTNLAAGEYKVLEGAVAGWTLAGIVIDDPDGGSSGDLAAGTATIDLDPGEFITVTFTNRLNQPPVANAGGPYVVDEGGSVTLSALDSDDDVGITRYEWDFDSDGVYDDSEESQPVFSAAGMDGPYNVTVGLRVTDEMGLTAVATAVVQVRNAAPTVSDLDLTPQIYEGGVAVLSGTISDPCEDDTFTLFVDWGQGLTQIIPLDEDLPPGVTFDSATGEFTVEHQYLDDGASPGNGTPSDLYAVTGRVVDDDGGWAPLLRPIGPRIANDDNDSGWTVTQQIQAGEPIGQTFTAISDNRLSTIAFYVADMNDTVAPTDYSIEFELYEGVGTSGRLLGTRDYTGLSDGFSGFVAVDFSAVTLVDGQVYTAVLSNDTPRWGRVACGNQYAGGTAIYAGAPSPTSDALFIVQWQPDRQPPRIANEDNDTGWTVTQQIQAGEPIGQTFTAISDNRLDTISFYVADMNSTVAPTDYSIEFELYEGVGTSGRRLGTREYTGLSDGFSGFVSVDFSAVTLVDGQVYTAVLDNDTARWGRVACGNQYAGGTAIYADAPSPTADALFVVQWQRDGQPPRIANEDNDTGWTVTQQIQAGEPIGQSFTAISDNRLDTISFYVSDMNSSVAPTDYSVTFELYEGVGTSGRLLGRREYGGLSGGFSGFIAADFSAVTLADGQMYTAVLTNDTPRWGRVACGNQYAGGTAIYADAPSPTSDALFVIEWQPDGQPPQIANDDNDTGWTVTQQILAGEPIGQTFTAISDNRLDTISFYVADMNAGIAPDDYSLTFELYEGLGTGGRLLGQREYTTLTPDFSGFIEVDFSAVTLVDGEMYTAVLSNDTARWGRVACGNQYAGGTALYADSPSPTSDALFRVTWQPDAQPPRIANDDNDSGWSVTQPIQAGEPIGQTFTAISDYRLSRVSFYVADMNASVAPTDHSVTFELYEGVGTGGRRLGTREYTALWDGFSGFISVDFSAVTLVDGGAYTAVLTNDTARWGRVATGNQYAGGAALYADAESPTADALFRIGWRPAPSVLVVEVDNVAPAFEAGPDEALPVGVGAFSRTVEFTDPGVLDVHTVTADYGDGSGPQVIAVPLGDREFNLAHVYAVRGEYVVSVTVVDDDGQVAHDEFWVIVHINLPPEADAGGPYFVDEGGSVQLSALDSDDDVGITRYEWDFDSDGFYDDSEEIQPMFPAATRDGPQNVVVGLRVTDEDGATDVDTAVIHVRNVAPTVSDLELTSPIDEGQVTTLSGVVRDPGAADTLTLEVDWSEGLTQIIPLVPPLPPGVTYTPATGEFTVAHRYVDDGPSPGNGTASDLYTVTGRVVDDDGGWTPLLRPVGPRIANDDNESGWTVTQQIQAGEPIGQTFTAISDNRLDTLSFYVADMNDTVAPTDYSIEFALYEGIGTTGRLLGRRDYTGLSNGFEGFVSVDFSAVTLVDGQVYTAVLENDTARWGRVACGNQYAGGTAIYAGAPSPTSDALFIVQWQPDRQPPRLANDDNDTGWTVTQQIMAGEPIGQTFTAISNNRLDTISFYVADMNSTVAPTDYSIEFELYEGIGTSGRRLGTREYTGLSDGFSGFVSVDFSAVTLLAGQMYTAVLGNDTARWGRVACGNQYAGGTAIYAGAPSPTSDALFVVRWQWDAQPPQIANDDNDTGWTVTQQIQAGEPIGQSFTAISDNRLDTISFYVADMNSSVAPTDYSVTFELYEGVGVSGRLLGRRDYTGLSDGFSGFIEVDFSAVTLLAGDVYTAVLTNDTARWGRVACGNQYAGGTAIYAGAPSPTSDALFEVQWQPDGQPPQIDNDDNDTGWTVTQQIQAGEPIGQTFTAISDNRLDTISFFVADMNAGIAPDDYSLTFELYEGLGTGGRLLGQREYTTLTPDFSGFIEVDFSAVTLVDGDLYTAVLSNDTARWGRVACGNQYAGGTALYADSPSPTSDALFRVTWQPDQWLPRVANDDNDTGWTVTQQIQAGEPIGQTFTAISDHRLSSLSFYVADMNASVAPADHSVTFELYEGVGTSGRRLGTREYTALWDGFSGFIAVDFSAVTLVDGQMYTAVLSNDTARWGRVACGNQYAGGTALYADLPSPTADALFRIGWQPAPSLLFVEVHNVPPVFEAGPDEVLAAGAGAFARTIAFTDPGLLDVHTVTVDYGDGSPLQAISVPLGDREFDLAHTYSDGGDFTVTVTVIDDDLGHWTDSFRVTVSFWDWGDAPDSQLAALYPTLGIHNGARHVIRGPWLGDATDRPDAEPDGQPDVVALGDDLSPTGLADDEDGVVFPPLVVGQTNYVSFEVQTDATMEAYVSGWIDFNGDKTWDNSEQFVSGMFGQGVHTVPVAVPDTAVPGTTFARVRITGPTSQQPLGPTGPADSGEVEDHLVRIVALPENTKWVQLPDLSSRGIDVSLEELRIAADDFLCTATSLLTDVHLWGSWRGDVHGQIQNIHLSIHHDDPVGPAGTNPSNQFSQPEPLELWGMDFGRGEFTEQLYYTVPAPGEFWWDPLTGELIPGGDKQVWQIDIPIDRADAFLQRGSEAQPVIYWLDVRVTTSEGEFGWKTRQWPDHFQDDAVWSVWELPMAWRELTYPAGHPYHQQPQNSIDLAFALTFEGVSALMDWGDAPQVAGTAGYPTTAALDGARHVLRGPWLGDASDNPDAELDGQPDPNALGDDISVIMTDDEDGVVIPPLVVGQQNYVSFQVSLPPSGVAQAYVDGWIDFDADKTWDASEQFVSGWFGPGTHTVAVTPPAAVVSTAAPTFARVRINSLGPLAPTGLALNGEVEDHEVQLISLPENTKWAQLPDLSPRGIDVRVDGLRIAADDFQCTENSLLTDVHLWGSWKGDEKGQIQNIHLSIHADDPVGSVGSDPDNQFSQPEPGVLWAADFGPGQFSEGLYYTLPEPGEYWWDPATGELIPDGDNQVWQIKIPIDLEDAFLQKGTPDQPVIYWLDVRVTAENGQFGWKTRQWPDHFMDDAVWDYGSELPRTWEELRYPEGHPYHGLEQDSLDMAFALTFQQVRPLDWGDAPVEPTGLGYPTLAVQNGARHIIQGPWLGDAGDRPDAEPDGQPHLNALGDDLSTTATDDEDGVVIPTLTVGQQNFVFFEVQTLPNRSAYVDGWIDYNGNKQWEAGEQFVSGWFGPGQYSWPVTPPVTSVLGQTFARVRINSRGPLSPTGPAADGEVEDHAVQLVALPHNTKWAQLPDLSPNGIDVKVDDWRIAADDFQCTDTSLLTGVRLWGSWKEDWHGRIENIHLSIHADDPVGPGGNDPENTYSMPDPEVLWTLDVGPGEFSERPYYTLPAPGEYWWDPLTGELLAGGDRRVVQLDIPIDPTEAFLQRGTPQQPVIYWLDVKVTTTGGEFGWKTRQWPEHFMDDAVWDFQSMPPTWWRELRYPVGHPYHGPEENSIDLAFALAFQDVADHLDWGDAPEGVIAGYPTLAISNGARHVIQGPWLGDPTDRPDAERDGQPDAHAMGDDLSPTGLADDEDGVRLPKLVVGQTTYVSFEVSLSTSGAAQAYVDGWIDFNGNKNWEATEQFVSGWFGAGIHQVAVTTPGTAVEGETFARVRINSRGPLSPVGLARDGEVEDHAVQIVALPDGTKWVQLPDLSPNGIDVAASGPRMTADDFLCRQTSFLTDVHLWGSWKGDVKGEIGHIQLSIRSDDPAGAEGADDDNLFSQPGDLLWSHGFGTGEFSEREYFKVPLPGEYWWDPATGELIPGGDDTVWQIDIPIPADDAFLQKGDPDRPVVYWLDVRVTAEEGQFGWKTRQWPDHFRADAVWTMSMPPWYWQELQYPEHHPYHDQDPNSIDLAFALTFQPPAIHLDWGDAPDSAAAVGYPTLAINNGARHIIQGPWLGDASDAPDTDMDGQPHPLALGDDLDGQDDENGVVIPPLVLGQTTYAFIDVHTDGTMQAYVDGWIDFDGDKAWEASEQFVSGLFGGGLHRIAVTPPAGAVVGPTFARVRINGSGPLPPDGLATSGEVEDHVVEIRALPDNTKWAQLPDLSPNGIDVRVDDLRIAADDFECRETSLLTDVHLWGSWKNDVQGRIENIHLSIHADDPVGAGGSDPDNVFSKPEAEELWGLDFGAGQFSQSLYYSFSQWRKGEYWWDPLTNELLPGGDRQVWQIEIPIDPAQAFLQRGSADQPVIYWLDVRVRVDSTSTDPVQADFGWKTRQWPDHFMDDAVWDAGSELPRTWEELRYPQGHPYHGLEKDSIDLAFALTFQHVAGRLDWGDAPQVAGASGYPTTAANNGARHVIQGPWLGDATDGPDAEPDGQPHPQALGDDLVPAGSDDEDGVAIPPLLRGQVNYATVTVNTGGAVHAYVDGWIDYNQDRQWQADEQFVSGWFGPGVHTLPVTPPASAVPGETFARVRINSRGPLPPTGPAADGEVEDHRVVMRQDLIVVLPFGNGSDDVTVRRSGTNVEIYDNVGATVLASGPLDDTRLVRVVGAPVEDDRLTVDYAFGGFFALADGVQFDGGAGGNDLLTLRGTGTTSARYVSTGGALGEAALATAQGTARNNIQFTQVEPLTVQSLRSFAVDGDLNVGAQTLTLGVATPAGLDWLTTLDGGSILAAGGLALDAAESLIGSGLVQGRLAAGVGSSILATGDLQLGDAASLAGFYSDGELFIGGHSVTLRDANVAVLGSLTELGNASQDGTLNTTAGALLEEGKVLHGRGVVNQPFRNNGFVSAIDPGITFNGLVTGIGDFEGPITFNGGYSPGLSPAQIDFFDTATFTAANTLTIEIGGLKPGDQFDRLDVAGQVWLDGTLDVDLIDGFVPVVGDSFEIISAAGGVTDTFATETLPTLPAGRRWLVQYHADDVTLAVVPATLIVTQLTPTPSGFVAQFSGALELPGLNLYDGAAGTLGAADVILKDSANQVVVGSMVVSDDRQAIEFVKTGGVLTAGAYSVTLKSGASAFRDVDDNPLDGNKDGTAGDDFTATFTVAASSARIVSIRDMARGAGQSVNIPNTAAGLPIRLDSAAGVTSLAVDLRYEQTLLQITAATLAAGVPADWSVTLDTSTAGVAQVTASGTTPLSGTNVDVVRLTAAVPSTAAYGASQAIHLGSVSLNSGAIAAVGDVAVHKAVYLGDADSSGVHSSADAFLVVQAALGSASGFAAHPWTDPRIVGDCDASGALSAADAFLIVQEGLGLVEPFVPDNPHIGITPVGGGVDPQFQIGVNLPASAGGLVTVPVRLAIEPAATNVGALDFELFFDSAQLTIDVPSGISAGADTAGGWAISARLIDAGHLRVGMISSRGQPLAVGLREIARLQFHVAASLRDAIPLAARAAYDDTLPVSERPGYVALDIEPVDPRAGGYTWTDADGSVLIRPAPRTLAGAARERIWRDLDAKADLLENVLADLVHDLATA